MTHTKITFAVFSLASFRKNIFIVVISLFSSLANAQWRLDGGVRMGRSNLRFMQNSIARPWIPMSYRGSFSWGADINAGYEFKYGLGFILAHCMTTSAHMARCAATETCMEWSIRCRCTALF